MISENITARLKQANLASKNDTASFIKKTDFENKLKNLYICFPLNPQLRNLNTDFTLGNCLYGSVKLTKNAGLDKHKYTGYGIGFHSCSEFSFTNGSFGKLVIIF